MEAAFAGIPEVKVIEPEYAATFLTGLKAAQIAALTSSILADDDPVLAEVRTMASEWTEGQLALFVEVLACHVEGASPPTEQVVVDECLCYRFELAGPDAAQLHRRPM